MAFAVLSPLARVREMTGLGFIYCPDEQIRDALMGRPPRPVRPAPQPATPTRNRPGAPAWQGQSPNRAAQAPVQRPAGGTPWQGRQQQPRPGTALQNRPAQTWQSREQQPAQPLDTTLLSAPQDISVWPAPWQELFARTRRGKLAWTYYGLGFDLCGYPNKARSRLLAELIRFLAKPQGTHTFWPVGLPAPDEEGKPVLVPDRRVFWQGLHALGARVLVVMGSPAARSIGIAGRIRPLQPMQAINGLRVLITRDIDLMDEKHFLETKTYLKQMLTPLL